MRLIPSLLLILCLSACQRGQQNDAAAVRQGILDKFSKSKDLNIQAMDVKVTSVKFDGDKADAVVDVTAKGQPGGGMPPMSLKYHLERQGDKWVVVGAATDPGHGATDPNGGGANPHGGDMPPAMPGADNPHGGAMPGGGTGKMPSPQDLPPATKK